MAFGLSWWSTMPGGAALERLERPEHGRPAQHLEVERGVEPPPDLLAGSRGTSSAGGAAPACRGPAPSRGGGARRRAPASSTAPTPPQRWVSSPARTRRSDPRVSGQASGSAVARVIGRLVRHSPSRSCRAAATAPAVGHEADLADALDAVGRVRLRRLDEDHVDRRHVLGPQDAEAAQRHVGREPGLGVGREVLGQRVAEAHVDASPRSGPRTASGSRPGRRRGRRRPARSPGSRSITTSWAA